MVVDVAVVVVVVVVVVMVVVVDLMVRMMMITTMMIKVVGVKVMMMGTIWEKRKYNAKSNTFESIHRRRRFYTCYTR